MKSRHLGLLITLSICYFVYLYKNIKPTQTHLNSTSARLKLKSSCTFSLNDFENSQKFETKFQFRKQVNKILLISTTSTSNNTKEFINLLESMRYDYDTLYISKLVNQRAYLTKLNNKFYYSLIVIDSSELFINEKYRNLKEYLLGYVKHFSVGLIVAFNNYDLNKLECFSAYTSAEGLRIRLEPRSSLKECKLRDANEVFKITKPNTNENVLISNDIEPDHYVLFDGFKNGYESLLECDGKSLVLKSNQYISIKQILIVVDLNELLIYSSLLLDFISYATNGRLNASAMQRFIQIDIDDIFVGATGKRMVPADVDSLIDFQENYLNKFYFNTSLYRFKFNLGFSGHYYQSGNEFENRADQMLIGNYFVC